MSDPSDHQASLAVQPHPKKRAKYRTTRTELARRTAILIEASLSDNTRRSYRGAVLNFVRWCDLHGYGALPADPPVLADYLADLMMSGKRASTAKLHASAIAYEHRRFSFDSPTESYLVSAVLRGAKRLRGGYVNRKRPVTADEIAELLQRIPTNMIGKRDKALIVLGFAGALRRSELAAIRLEDLEFTQPGLTLKIRSSKTDLERQGVVIGIPEGRRLNAISILRDWITAAGITRGALFRPVYGNTVLSRSVTPLLVSRILKRHLAEMGRDPTLYGSHSLRVGFITSAAENGVSAERIMDHSRHATIENVRAYVRRANLLRDHPGDGFL